MNRRVLVSMSMAAVGCATPSSPHPQPESAQTAAGELAAEESGALAEDPVLNGEVWWYDASVEECQAWLFVRGEDHVALERRTIEAGEGWSREVRVFYNIVDQTDVDPRVIYAAGYDYSWVEAPGPDAASGPGQRGPIGCVATFDVVESTDELIRWSDSGCVRGPKAWYRSKQLCEENAE